MRSLALLAFVIPFIVVPPAAAEETGEVVGSIWIDENEDGLRQPGEPPLAGYPLILNDMWTGYAQTDANGNYRFENVQPGSYRISWYGRGTWTFTKGGGDSDFDPNTGRTELFTVDGGTAGPFNGGLVKERVDTAVTDVKAPKRLQVGTEVDVKVTFANTGNSPTPLTGKVLFPDGITPLSSNAPVTSIEGQTIYLSSVYQADSPIGGSVTYTIRARVDAPIDCGELVAEATNPWDTNEKNNVRKATVRT